MENVDQLVETKSREAVFKHYTDYTKIDWKTIEDPLAYFRDPANNFRREESNTYGYPDGYYRDKFLDNPGLAKDDIRLLLGINPFNIDQQFWSWRAKDLAKARKDGLFDLQHLPSVSTVRKNVRALRMVCAETNIYEVPTREYIDSLSKYLEESMNDLQEKSSRPVIVLEIGAGKGILSWHLQQKFEADGLDSNLIKASDSKTWEKTRNSTFPVEELGYKEAVEKYGASYDLIVICSWMAPNEDWTADLVKDPAVKEIVLIGPANEPVGNIETWDEKPGFEQIDVSEQYNFPPQFNHFDEIIARGGGEGWMKSKTTSFRRLGQE